MKNKNKIKHIEGKEGNKRIEKKKKPAGNHNEAALRWIALATAVLSLIRVVLEILLEVL